MSVFHLDDRFPSTTISIRPPGFPFYFAFPDFLFSIAPRSAAPVRHRYWWGDALVMKKGPQAVHSSNDLSAEPAGVGFVLLTNGDFFITSKLLNILRETQEIELL